MLECHDLIWNHHKKCIELTTHMPSIGLEIPEIAFEISELLTKSRKVCTTNGRMLSVYKLN